MKIQNIGYSNPAIKRIKDLKKHSDNTLVVVEDLSTLEHLMNKNQSLELFIYCPTIINQESTKRIVEYYATHSIEAYEVSEKVFFDLVEKENRAGLIGIYKDKILKLENLDPSTHEFILVLDGIEIPGNMGTLFRTADGCGVDAVIVVNEVTKVTSVKQLQASRGMSLFIDKVVCSYEEAQAYLLYNKYDIYLGEPELGQEYTKYNYEDKCAIVVGSERFGIDERWYKNDHKKVFIPMKGMMKCLNVSIAGSILLYEAFMKRNKNK